MCGWVHPALHEQWQGRPGAGWLLEVLGLELVPAAGGGMGMTEGPAGPERLKTGKSETNDRQSVTAGTEQLLFLMSAVKWPSEKPIYPCRAVLLGWSWHAEGLCDSPSQREEKNLPRNPSPHSPALIYVCLCGLLHFSSKLWFVFPACWDWYREKSRCQLDFKEFLLIFHMGKAGCFTRERTVRVMWMDIGISSCQRRTGLGEQGLCTNTRNELKSCVGSVCPHSRAQQNLDYFSCILMSLLVVKMVWMVLLLRAPLRACSFTVYCMEGLSSVRL